MTGDELITDPYVRSLAERGEMPQEDDAAPGFTRGIDRVVASHRDEHEPCQAGTPGCCIDHTADPGSCETW